MKLNWFLLMKILWTIGASFADLNEKRFRPPETMKCIPPTENPCLTPISAQEKQQLRDNCGKKNFESPRKYIHNGEEIEFSEAPWTSAIFLNGLFCGILH